MQTKEPFEQLSDFGKLATKIAERVNKYTMETSNDFFTASAEQIKKLSGAKKIEDSFELQKQMMTEAGSKWVNSSKKAWEVSMQNYADISEWLENNAGFMKSMSSINPMNYSQSKPTAEKKS